MAVSTGRHAGRCLPRSRTAGERPDRRLHPIRRRRPGPGRRARVSHDPAEPKETSPPTRHDRRLDREPGPGQHGGAAQGGSFRPVTRRSAHVPDRPVRGHDRRDGVHARPQRGCHQRVRGATTRRRSVSRHGRHPPRAGLGRVVPGVHSPLRPPRLRVDLAEPVLPRRPRHPRGRGGQGARRRGGPGRPGARRSGRRECLAALAALREPKGRCLRHVLGRPTRGPGRVPSHPAEPPMSRGAGEPDRSV
jgi:hypothetical protein